MPHSQTDNARHILLAVAAKSPQVITETIYALATRTPAWLPTELHVITTGLGAKNIQNALLPDGENWLAKLCADYQLPTIELPAENLHIITDSAQQPLEDIRNTADNACAADYITQKVRQLTADPTSCLYASLSGGRRTMTYYMGYALSLFGRPQDRLLHVLIEDDYFFNNEFYYPPPQSKLIHCKNGTQVDAAHIEVTLAELPFLRLRDNLPTELFTGSQRFTEIISATQARIVPPKIQFNYATHELTCGDTNVTMPPAQLAFYVWMLERAKNQKPAIHWTDNETPTLAEQYLTQYRSLFGDSSAFDNIKKSLKDGLNKAWFDERKSNTHKALKAALGHSSAIHYVLTPSGQRPKTRFGINLRAEMIYLLDK